MHGREHIFINQRTMVHSLVKGNAAHATPADRQRRGGGGTPAGAASSDEISSRAFTPRPEFGRITRAERWESPEKVDGILGKWDQ